MKRKKYIIASIIVLLEMNTVQAQVVTNMSTEYGAKEIVTTTGEGAVEEQDYESPDGIMFQWEDTYKDFKKFDGAKEIDEKVKRKTGSYQPLAEDWSRFKLPVILDENGIDLFLLTEDGIRIYMAMDEPAYYEEVDDDIVKWIRYYAYRKRRHTKSMFKRYQAWENHIKIYFQSQGVPPELSELCLIESACTYSAKSPVGALGMWQIMPETGRAYGMVINPLTDDRLDPVKSTIAASKILHRNFERIGNWTLAAAAYNCGPARFLNKENYGKTWPQVKRHLPKETQQYIPSLIAIHYVWTYKKQLGFD